MFSSDGNFLREIKLQHEPASLTFTESGNAIACSLVGDDKIWSFSVGGEFIKHFNVAQLKNPAHLSVCGDGRIITCDWADNKIKVLSADGKDLMQPFSDPDCDSNPWCAVYHQDIFFVSYPDANCVKVFNSAGVYLYDIGCEGSGDGQLCFPLGLVIDKFNQLIVCDENNKRLQVFTLDGKILSTTKRQHGDRDGVPFSAAVSNMGHLVFTDLEKHCIFAYQ